MRKILLTIAVLGFGASLASAQTSPGRAPGHRPSGSALCQPQDRSGQPARRPLQGSSHRLGVPARRPAGRDRGRIRDLAAHSRRGGHRWLGAALAFVRPADRARDAVGETRCSRRSSCSTGRRTRAASSPIFSPASSPTSSPATTAGAASPSRWSAPATWTAMSARKNCGACIPMKRSNDLEHFKRSGHRFASGKCDDTEASAFR